MDAIEKKTRELLSGVRDSKDGVAYLTTKAAAASIAAGMLIANGSMKDGKGSLAHALTPFGVNYLASPEGTDPATITGDKTTPAIANQSAPAGSAAAGTVAGKDGTPFARVAMALPAATNVRQSNYPTDKLVAPVKGADGMWIYDGLFLEPKNGVADPAKAYPAVASAATKRHKDDSPPRKFISRTMDGAPFGKPGVNGVGIFRVDATLDK